MISEGTASGGGRDSRRRSVRLRRRPRRQLPRLDPRRVRLLRRGLRRCRPSRKDFGTDIKAIALTITVTLAFRPVGAFIFGLMADRYGRRLPLMIDLVFYSVVEVLSGFAPNYTTFLILRALFGIGMGGEWGIGASLAMEKVPAALARRIVGPAPGGLRRRLSPRGLLLLLRLPDAGAGGRCSSSAGCPRCSRSSSASA